MVGWWEQQLIDATVGPWSAHCRACGHRWPVTAGDAVPVTVRAMDRAAVEAVRQAYNGTTWSEGGARTHE